LRTSTASPPVFEALDRSIRLRATTTARN
jgi:hypothetical protein